MTLSTRAHRASRGSHKAFALKSLVLAGAFLTTAGLLLHSTTHALVRHVYSASDLAPTLVRAGLDAESLCAAGVSVESIDDVVDNAQAYLENNISTLLDADDDVGTARSQHDWLKRTIEAGTATEEQVSSYPAAVTALNSALADRAEALDAVFFAATDGLAGGVVEQLASIRANRLLWDQPTAYLVVAKTEPERYSIREALANERVCAQTGDTPDPAAQELLAQLRANTDVAAALENLQESLPAASAAWAAATGPQS